MATPSRINPKQARIIAKELFLASYSDGGIWFDIAWSALLDQKSYLSKKRKYLVPGSSEGILKGLQIAGTTESYKERVRGMAILVATFAIESPIFAEALTVSLESNCKKYGERTSRTQRLIELLNTQLQNVNEPEVDRDVETVLESVIVESMIRGKNVDVNSYKIGYAKSVPSRNKYDIVVDEYFRREVRIKKGEYYDSKSIFTIRKMQMKMLWLVLSNVSRGVITHRDIKKLPTGKKVEAMSVKAIYQYPNQLGQLLGRPLRNAILVIGSDKKYEIKQDGWSFCWIREKRDYDSSLLVSLVKPV